MILRLIFVAAIVFCALALYYLSERSEALSDIPVVGGFLGIPIKIAAIISVLIMGTSTDQNLIELAAKYGSPILAGFVFFSMMFILVVGIFAIIIAMIFLAAPLIEIILYLTEPVIYAVEDFFDKIDGMKIALIALAILLLAYSIFA